METKNNLPYRVVLSTWMDQMQLSREHPGACIGFSIEPTQKFNERCGMGTSTRASIKKIWGTLPKNRNPVELSKLVFCVDNPPTLPVEPNENFPWGSYAARWITGSIDPITLIVPGVSYCNYNGKPWPDELETIKDSKTLDWLENIVTLVPTKDRPPGEAFQLDIKPDLIKKLSYSSDSAWEAIKEKDTYKLAEAVNGCRQAINSFSNTYMANTVKEKVDELLEADVLAAFPQGAGCGGYIACISEIPNDRIKIRIRRK
jgi:hypothetical protein